MKSHIFISIHYMEIGGAETALIGLLNALDPSKVEVDLFLHDHRGEMLPFVPSWVHVLPTIPGYTVLERPIKELMKRGFWFIAAARLISKISSTIVYKRSGSRLSNASVFHYMAAFTTPLLPKINPKVKYDLAISFLTPHQITLQKVDAQKRIAWIHTDYTKIWVDSKAELSIWSRYNYIASISEDVSNTFLRIFPSLASKIVQIENIVSPSFVKERANMLPEKSDSFFVKENKVVKLLSVGRFSEAKNNDYLPDICRRIVEKGLNVKWYVIGYGSDETLIRQNIAKAKMQEHVIILGKRSNPYPYIKACDIYVQPSRYEGKSVTVREAQILRKPVVVTNYPTAPSQINQGVDGVIVPLDNEGCAVELAKVIKDKELQKHLVDYLSVHDYGNESEVEKIYSILNC